MMTDGLTEGCPSDSVTATVHSQDSHKDAPGPQAQQQGGDASAEAPMLVDADDAQLNDRCMFPRGVDQVTSPPPSPSFYPPLALPCVLL